MSYDDDEYFGEDEEENGGKGKKDPPPPPPSYWIDINGLMIPFSSLFSIEAIDSYDNKKNRPLYKVLVNKTDNPKVVNGNREIVFHDCSERDVFLHDIRELMEGSNVVFINNKNDE